MSTRVACPDADALVSYLYGEFEPGARPNRDEVERHLESCPKCAEEAAALGGVRTQLAAWTTPPVELGFQVVPAAPARTLIGPRSWFRWSARPFPAAAAAVLVLAAAVGLARLDVQYDAQGLRIRTGWGHAPDSANTAARSTTAPHPAAAAAVSPASPSRASLSEVELAAIVARVRDSIGHTVSPATVVGGDPAAGDAKPARTTAADADILRRVRQIVEESEVRQQQNLQLRVAELSQDFQLQRKADLVQIEQGFGRLTNENLQQRQFMNQYMRNVSATSRPPQ